MSVITLSKIFEKYSYVKIIFLENSMFTICRSVINAAHRVRKFKLSADNKQTNKQTNMNYNRLYNV